MENLSSDPRLEKAVDGLRSLLDLRARDIMQTNVITLDKNDLLATAARSMIESEINGLVIMDGDEIFSVLSSWQLLHVSYLESFSDKMDYLKSPLSEIIEKPAYESLPPTATLAECVATVARTGFRTIPIVEDGDLRGVISAMDILKIYDDKILKSN